MNSYYIELNNNISLASIWIEGGIYEEKEEKKGLNQILLSLLTRGCKDYDKYSFSDFLDSYGAELQYEATDDGIFICLKSLNQYFNKIYPLLNLLLEEPNLYEEEFLTCKKYAINNVAKAKENQFNITFDNWNKLIYKNQPYEYNLNGSVESINLINYEDILNEYKALKKRDKFSLCNIKKPKSLNINDLKITNKNKKIINLKTNKLDNINNFTQHFSKSKQVIIMLGSKTCTTCHDDNLSLKILESYLSYGMSSLLFRTFRENNGLTYDSGVFYPTRKFSAPFLIYLSVSDSNAILAFKLIISLWDDLITKLISCDELSLAKVKLKSSFLHNNQNIEDIIYRKVRLISLKMDPFYDEKSIKIIERITAEEILGVSKKYFEHPSISISGSENICKRIKEIWKKN